MKQVVCNFIHEDSQELEYAERDLHLIYVGPDRTQAPEVSNARLWNLTSWRLSGSYRNFRSWFKAGTALFQIGWKSVLGCLGGCVFCPEMKSFKNTTVKKILLHMKLVLLAMAH